MAMAAMRALSFYFSSLTYERCMSSRALWEHTHPSRSAGATYILYLALALAILYMSPFLLVISSLVAH
jgi:hypothetical protein